MPAAHAGECGTVGVVLTHHELLFDIITLARQRGWNGDTPTESSTSEYVELVLESSQMGTGVIADVGIAAVLRSVADRAFRWLDKHSPAGYRFALRDGLYLDPIRDLNAEVLAPEAVIEVARQRQVLVPQDVEQLATAHVRVSIGGWVALHHPRVVAGPLDTSAEAVAIVESARNELAGTLRVGGSADLAATRARWAPVPIETKVDHIAR